MHGRESEPLGGGPQSSPASTSPAAAPQVERELIAGPGPRPPPSPSSRLNYEAHEEQARRRCRHYSGRGARREQRQRRCRGGEDAGRFGSLRASAGSGSSGSRHVLGRAYPHATVNVRDEAASSSPWAAAAT